MKKLLLILAVLLCTFARSQNTEIIKVMSYNLLNFPDQSPNRIDTLEGILQFFTPDILMVCELTSGTGANAILSSALNTGGTTSYAKADYVAGPDTQNMLYYNSDKLGLIEQNEIPTALRDINEYVLYYKSDDIATTQDTTFFYIYVCHLKASQGNESLRNAEAQELKDYLATRTNRENVLVGGDFNFYGSDTETAWNTILSGSGVTLVDPINTPGHWHTDWGYADIHTQSPRTTQFDGGANGGMDDRFDFIFMSPDLNGWGNQAKYVDGTYKALGNDGNHYNKALIDDPWNTSYPANIIWNLYSMSDHLPIYMEIEVQRTYNSIVEEDYQVLAYYNFNDRSIVIESQGANLIDETFVIYDMSGNEVQAGQLKSQNATVKLENLSKGLYILRLANNGYTYKFIH